MKSTILVSIFLCLAVNSLLPADIVLDLDGTTPTIESALTVPVGTVLNVHAVEFTGVSTPRDRVGLDFYYQLIAN